MKALDRKLLRDLARIPGQAVTIAVVVALGIASYLSTVSTWQSLVYSRDQYYASSRFADVFARVVRAPRTVLPRLESIEGVARVDARITEPLRVEVPGFGEPVRGIFSSVDPAIGLNRLFLVEGHPLERDDEVLVSEQFGRAHQLEPGDGLHAIINGRRMDLTVAGIALSPEYVWVLPLGAFWSDDLRTGVFWMTRGALETALGLEDAFNDVVLSISPGAGASVPAVIDAVDRVLEPWGSFGAHGRDKQASNRQMSQELSELEGMAAFLPVIFLGVAAFLVNVVLSRVVSNQREQIAALKALGYSNLQVARHYALFALTIVGAGTVGGVLLGAWLGHALVGVYTRYFHFPALEYRLEPSLAATAVSVSLGAGLLGALAAVRRVVRLAPAEAMRPEAPVAYRQTVLDRTRATRLLPVGLRMVLRDLIRQPVRLALSSAAIAFSTAILVAGNASIEAITELFEIQFSRVQREDLEVSFIEPQGAPAQRTVAGLPGVYGAELERLAPVRIRAAQRSRDVVLRSVPADGRLRQLVDRRGKRVKVPPGGVAISRALAELLGVEVGGTVELELLQGGRERRQAKVAGLIDDSLGLSAYADAGDLQQFLGETRLADGMLLSVDPALIGQLEQRLYELPAVTNLSRPSQSERMFKQQVTEVISIYQWVLAFCAGAIAVGVVYNNARIALAARGRDLATLRILGFTRGEVLSVLAGEQLAQLALGIPIGLPLGQWLARAMYARFNPELYRIWIDVSARTYAVSATVVLVAGMLSLIAVRRGVRKLNLVSVLKARD